MYCYINDVQNQGMENVNIHYVNGLPAMLERHKYSLKDNSWWGKAPLGVPVSDATVLQQNAHTETSRVRWRNVDRGGTPTECSGMITSSISNCLLPLTTNTAMILSEQHVSNKFAPSWYLHLPGKKIDFSNVCCYFSWFSYILTSMNMAWLFWVKFHCNI